MSTGVWFHCFAGIAGDMALGSLIDAGADINEVRNIVKTLDVPGWTIDAETTQRAGVRATHLLVDTEETNVSRTYTTIKNLIEQAELPGRVRERSLAVFKRLAEVEAHMHGQPIEHVHFHEVGGLDAIVDVVGTCAALELLGVDHVCSSAVATGTGTIRAAHGILPNPAPAVVGLLEGAPVYGLAQPMELTTPTGAAILSALAEGFGPMPSFSSITSSGFGAGTRDLDGMPNCTQVVVGTLAVTERRTDAHGQPVTLLEVNVDDATGEVIAHAVARMLEVGAHDAWITPIVMKKGRPAYTVSALVDVALVDVVATTMMNETGSFGIRAQTMDRWPAKRHTDSVVVGDDTVSLKVATHRAKAEFDEAAAAAVGAGRPARQVVAEAESTHRSAHHEHGPGTHTHE